MTLETDVWIWWLAKWGENDPKHGQTLIDESGHFSYLLLEHSSHFYSEFILGNTKIYFFIFYHFSKLRWCRYWKSFPMGDNDQFILHIQYHGCWRPDDGGGQGISSYGTDLIISNYLVSAKEWFNKEMEKDHWFTLRPKYSIYSKIKGNMEHNKQNKISSLWGKRKE